jgi:hypothetical protein
LRQESKDVRVTKKELVVKSLIYRVWTMCWESVLASILVCVGMVNLFLYIALVNTIKVVIYFGYDLGWFSFVKRPGFLKKVKRWLRVE